MSGLCGWAAFKGDVIDSQYIERMTTHLVQFDGSTPHIVVGKNSALSVAPNGTGKGGALKDGDVLAAIQGAFYWKDDELANIEKRESSAAALIRGYRARGLDVLKCLYGSFSVALIDESKQEAMMATDRLGIEPLVYTMSGDSLVFSSSSDAVCKHPSVSSDIDPQAIYNYLYFHVIPSPGTVYKQHNRLMPGSYLKMNNSHIDVKNYWHVEYSEPKEKISFQDQKDELFALMRQSVDRASEDGTVGAFLSGGTDSSTVSGLLCERLGKSAPTFSIGFDAAGFDEMEYARIAVKHFGTDHHEYYVTPEDIVSAIPDIAGIYSEPFGNSSAIPAYYCAKLAKSAGVTHLLAGDGGDELFAGNTRYLTQQLFDAYNHVPGILRKKIIDPVVMSSLYPSSISPLRKIKRYVEIANTPMPVRMETFNLLERFGAQHVLNADYLQQVDVGQPASILTDYYKNVVANTLLNNMLGLDLKFTLTDNDLPKVSKMCELAGMQVRYPLLSDELIDFSASLPSRLKIKRTYLRYFFKKSLEDFLPKEILKKKKHGFGLPFGVWVAEHKGLNELARDSLNSLKSRHIIQPSFIDELFSMHLKDHASYYGTMIWLLIMLEHWFQKHVD